MQGREVKNLRPSSADVRDESTSIIFLHDVERGKFYFCLKYNFIYIYIFIYIYVCVCVCVCVCVQSSTTIFFIRSLIYL